MKFSFKFVTRRFLHDSKLPHIVDRYFRACEDYVPKKEKNLVDSEIIKPDDDKRGF